MASVYAWVSSVYTHNHTVRKLGKELICLFSNYSIDSINLWIFNFCYVYISVVYKSYDGHSWSRAARPFSCGPYAKDIRDTQSTGQATWDYNLMTRPSRTLSPLLVVCTHLESGLKRHLRAYFGWAMIFVRGLSSIGVSPTPPDRLHTKQVPYSIMV